MMYHGGDEGELIILFSGYKLTCFSVSTNKDDAHRKWQNDEVQIIVATVCLEFLPSFTVRILIGV